MAQEGYLPTKLYDLNSAYGNYRELRALLRELQAQGVSFVGGWLQSCQSPNIPLLLDGTMRLYRGTGRRDS